MLEIEKTDRWRRLSAAVMMNEAVTANIMAWVAQRAAATLTQRESRQLAMESHYMRQSQRTRDKGSLESSGAPTNYAERLYRVVRRGRIKVESIKANQTREGEVTYLERGRVVKRPGNTSKHCYGL